MLKLKYKVLLDQDFMEGVSALGAITGIKSASVLIQVAKVVKAIKQSALEYNEARQKIMTDLGAAPGIVLPSDKKEELAARMKELLEMEFEIIQNKITLKDLPHQTLSGGHIASLEPILLAPELVAVKKADSQE